MRFIHVVSYTKVHHFYYWIILCRYTIICLLILLTFVTVFSHLKLLQIMLLWNSTTCLLTLITCVFLLLMYIRAVYLTQRVHVCSLFIDNASSFSKVHVIIHMSTAGYESLLLHILTNVVLLVFQILATLINVVLSYCSFNFLFVVVNEIKPLFICCQFG